MQTIVLLSQLELTIENVRVAALQVKVGDHVTAEQSLIEVLTYLTGEEPVSVFARFDHEDRTWTCITN